MRKYHIVIIPLISTLLGFATDVDSLNIQSMYDGAEEIEMQNRAMEAGMRQHNQQSEPIVIETTEEIMDNTPIEGFQELGDKYFLQRVIEDSEHSKVTVSTSGNMVKISTITAKKEHKNSSNGIEESTYSSSNIEELSLPEGADIAKLTKVYRDGILKISVPKR